MPPAPGCLSLEQLLAYAARELPAGELEEAARHLSACPECAARLAALARDELPARAPGPPPAAPGEADLRRAVEVLAAQAPADTPPPTSSAGEPPATSEAAGATPHPPAGAEPTRLREYQILEK